MMRHTALEPAVVAVSYSCTRLRVGVSVKQFGGRERRSDRGVLEPRAVCWLAMIP